MSSPKQVLERFYAAERLIMQGKATFEVMAATLADDVRLYQSPDLPFGGEYVGPSEYRTWAEKMAAIFDQVDVQDARFFEDGNTVVVVCTLVTRGRYSQQEMRYPMVQVVTVREDRIIEFRPFYWNVPAYSEAARAAASTGAHT